MACLSVFAPAQSKSPAEVDICDLANDPQRYDGSQVQLSGQIISEGGNLKLRSSSCQREPEASVLLLAADGSTNFRVDGPLAIPVDKVSARRLLLPDLNRCHGAECRFYQISVRIGGKFSISHEDMTITVDEVSYIANQRTAVPLGGQFQCSTETWTTEADQPSLCSAAECKQAAEAALVAAARHFGERIDVKSGTFMTPKDWISADLLTSYKFEPVSSRDNTSRQQKINITRESCTAISAFPPKPASQTARCETRRWYWQGDKQAAKLLQQALNQGGDVWRLDPRTTSRNAIDDVHKEWRVLPADSHMIDSCSNPSNSQGEPAECSWSSADGMQTYWVKLEKMGYLKHWGSNWDHIPWIATEIEANFCGNETAEK